MVYLNTASCGMLAFSSFALFSSHAIGAALPPNGDHANNDIEARQGTGVAAAGIIASIVGDITSIVGQIIAIGELDGQEHAKESAYTQGMVAALARQYPTKNVLIYHDQDSKFNGVNAVHYHDELDLGFFDTTQGYEIEVFDSGTFTLVGDGGYLNWCLAGNYVRNGNSVQFNQIAAPTQSIAPATTNPPIPPVNPTRYKASDTDGNYFVNCRKSDGTVSSGMAYYKNLVPGHNVGQKPDDYVDVTHGSYVTWETSSTVTFKSGVPVHWSIFGNAQDLGVNQSAGTADNQYEHFWVYKDSQEWLYSVDDWNCFSIYWAF